MDITKPDVLLIVGSTGAGKTTAARMLADENHAICFSIDEWMVSLFGPDISQPIRFEWMMERVNRCEAMIWSVLKQAATRGIPAILDLGFTTRAHRQKFRDMADSAGLTSAIYFIDVDANTRWERVQQRNHEQGETYAMQVDRDMFDFMEQRWEAPEQAEWEQSGGTRIA